MLMIEEFEHISDIAADLNPTDLSSYGIATPDLTSIGITMAIGCGDQKSFMDASQAIVTRTDGRIVTGTVGNALGCGENSSVTVPPGFEGYVAFPLSARSGFRSQESVTDLTSVDLLSIDVRPTNITENDRYVLGSLCLAEMPANPFYIHPNGDADTMTKQEKLESMIREAIITPPTYTYCPEYDPVGYPNIKAIWIDGSAMNGLTTRVFAYIGFPAGADANTPVPGIVLNHGGGGFAFPSWVDIWNQRGYAAIAIAIGNTGYYPAAEGITDFYSASSWTHRLPLDLRDEYRLPPDNDGMNSSTGDMDRMWMYHAVTQTIFANSILRGDDCVITDQIGITGISWGGVITSITIGYDDRFAFAIPVYGSGYLYESLAWMKVNFNYPGTRELWDASLRLKNVKMPVYWLAWTNDTCFSINSNDQSFADTKNGTLTFLMNWAHSHVHGWDPKEIYRFADSIVKGGEGLTTCTTQPSGGGNISFTIRKPADATAVRAKVYYLTEKMTYTEGTPANPADTHMEQTWQSVNASVSGDIVTATIPADACSYYVEITTVAGGQSYITTSRYIVLGE